MASIKDLKRMCENMMCKDCPLSGSNVSNCQVHGIPVDYPDEDIDTIVDKWVAEHPVKTYATDFFSKFPDAQRKTTGIPIPCIGAIYSEFRDIDCPVRGCSECWNREMKEDE